MNFSESMQEWCERTGHSPDEWRRRCIVTHEAIRHLFNPLVKVGHESWARMVREK